MYPEKSTLESTLGERMSFWKLVSYDVVSENYILYIFEQLNSLHPEF